MAKSRRHSSRSSSKRRPKRRSDSAARARARPIWSGTISFGLVTIPVQLAAAVKPGGVPLRMLDADGNPLRRTYVCPAHNREIHSDHLIRGFEIEPDKYVTITDEELESLAPRKSRDIDLRLFTSAENVDPMFF